MLRENKPSIVRSLLFGAIGAALFLWVAAYNGYPTVYPDTGGYLYTSLFFIAIPPFRAPGYSVFIRLTGLGTSAWFTVAIQAILVVIALFEICKYIVGGNPKFRDQCLLAIACALAALTSLPWETSQLMPDVFAGTAFLSAFLLAFNTDLGWMDQIGFAVILTISVSAHSSLLPIAALFLVALAIPRLLGWHLQAAPPKQSRLAWVLLPIVAAAYKTSTLNRETGLGFRLSASGDEFLLARLFDDGLAADYLRESCPKEQFVACQHLADLPTKDAQFMFWSPLLNEMAGHGDEISQVVRGAIAAHPVRFAMSSLTQTLFQLARFRPGDAIRASNLKAPNTNGIVIQQVFPGDVPAFSNARQARGRMNLVTKAAVVIDIESFCVSVWLCVMLARSQTAVKVTRRFHWAIVFLVINAAICGCV